MTRDVTNVTSLQQHPTSSEKRVTYATGITPTHATHFSPRLPPLWSRFASWRLGWFILFGLEAVISSYETFPYSYQVSHHPITQWQWRVGPRACVETKLVITSGMERGRANFNEYFHYYSVQQVEHPCLSAEVTHWAQPVRCGGWVWGEAAGRRKKCI